MWLRRGAPATTPEPSPEAEPHSALLLNEVHRRYSDGGATVTALAGVSLRVPRGSFLAVMGPSGSGKSTLLNCASGLDTVSSGSVRIGGTDTSALKEPRRTLFRRDRVGFVFQSYNLVPTLTAEDNITLPLRLAGRHPDRAWLRGLVERVGITDRLRHRPSELSGGQQQRVALVRALATHPEIVFADEPTGALDAQGARRILRLLADVVRDLGQTVVMVTHDPDAAAHAHTTASMTDGRIVDVHPAAATRRFTAVGGE
ncbi:ABC transporter ATP-binding protein [Halostreptopolyspora alba]|uniref:ABC transporter ATP-binding protein n=1 Tax=Halostreptopolyspora alba TaxID=2487137 RepID=A0A3N0E5Y5_9ACTN|nr:ABC transporter ATP-binding protein [Nocardiopsaceae bacterium YIM 96095]